MSGKPCKTDKKLNILDSMSSKLKLLLFGKRNHVDMTEGNITKLIITFGVSGAVQFAAGMKSSDLIVAVNTDPAASIFDVAHVAINADLYEIVPLLAQKIAEVHA